MFVYFGVAQESREALLLKVEADVRIRKKFNYSSITFGYLVKTVTFQRLYWYCIIEPNI